MSEGCPTFFGKYRGEVVDNLDLAGLGRVKVKVPDVLGDNEPWAMPCLPGAGPKVGLFVLPPSGAKIWVEFERGDPDYPIWVGGFWDMGDTPAAIGPQQPFTKAWVGDNFSIEIVDMQGTGTMTISMTTPVGEAKILADAAALTVSLGSNSVKLAPDGVAINGTNLKVLP